MGKIGKIWFFSALALFIVFIWISFQTFRPVQNVQPEDVMKIEGVVTDIKEGTGSDIVLALQNDDHYYYINRGLQHSLSLEKLNTTLLHKKVTLYGIKRWTIFTRDKNMGHISKLMIDDTVVYNEINNDIHEKTTK